MGDWIRMSDRLPEADGSYLVVVIQQAWKPPSRQFTCVEIMEFVARYGFWRNGEGDQSDASPPEFRVTHWQDVPELPEE